LACELQQPQAPKIFDDKDNDEIPRSFFWSSAIPKELLTVPVLPGFRRPACAKDPKRAESFLRDNKNNRLDA